MTCDRPGWVCDGEFGPGVEEVMSRWRSLISSKAVSV